MISEPIKLIRSKTIDPLLVQGKTKYFCIGRNKTGTTSLKKTFEKLGFIVGRQRSGETLLDEYKKENFEPIIEFCKTAQVFQDVPFSYAETFKYLDKAYPNSKFILSVRDNPEQWYNSVVKFHSKLFGKNGQIPTYDDLKNATYVRKGFMWDAIQINYRTPASNPYQKDLVIKNYLDHNADVLEYFKDRPDDLLVINLAESDSFQKFIDFIDVVNPPMDDFPWANKTSSLK
jgi:hypothetical protein